MNDSLVQITALVEIKASESLSLPTMLFASLTIQPLQIQSQFGRQLIGCLRLFLRCTTETTRCFYLALGYDLKPHGALRF